MGNILSHLPSERSFRCLGIYLQEHVCCYRPSLEAFGPFAPSNKCGSKPLAYPTISLDSICELPIKQEFRDLIPPLADHEKAGLEEDIKHFGCQQPLTIWDGYIIDGHHRYEICMRHKLSFKTEERKFASQNDAEIWIITNQFSRRNLTDFVRGELALAYKGILQEEAEERMKAGVSECKGSVKHPTQNFE